MKQSHKITIGVIVVVAAIGFLFISGFGGNTGYQKTITEILTEGPQLEGRYLLVEGSLVPGTLKWDGQKIELSFAVTDGQSKMPVVYNDVAPDNMDNPEAQIILKGKYNANSGTFLADKVETRCPSKYEALEEEQAIKEQTIEKQ
ncbi:hypothetical protein SY88_09460 [Clostridiales bacterium PH28_bin88]|nr:hypothetical protein SY88_09460 [Clostridiales bacterium PH28_bin88]